MLKLHVEYKEFSPLIARRALKLYIEQFDPDRVYLLADEALGFLNPKDKQLQAIVNGYAKDDYSEFEKLNYTIQNAISRARKLREETTEELLSDGDEGFKDLIEEYNDFAKDEIKLKERIKRHQVYLLMKEKQHSSQRVWTSEYRQKALELWQKRLYRMEESYLSADDNGKGLSEHFFCLHLLKALAKSLDAHSSYYSPEEAYEMRATLEKQFEGIGVVLRESVEGISIVGLLKGGPAERSGRIKTGDVIVTIDGKSIGGVSYEEVLRKLQNSNARVQLGLKRLTKEGEVRLKVSLVKEKIVMQEERLQYTAEPFADGIIGKLILPSFYESRDGSSCEKDLKNALVALKKQGKLLGLILDLRENSGGFLNQAVKVASLFISSGVVVISKYAEEEIRYMRNLDIRSYYDGPLIVLTSKASASAAEIVAQALQDYGTALVIGDERTYGKGTIQYQTITDSSASCFFKVTVGRYYTVSGRSTQIDGVLADIVVPTVYSAINIGERFLEFPLKNDRVPSAYTDHLTDIDHKNRLWFQQNYIPNLQKKLSLWVQMIPRLRENTAHRLSMDKDFILFMKAQEELKAGRSFTITETDNWGAEDLQLGESIRILKDMICIKRQESR